MRSPRGNILYIGLGRFQKRTSDDFLPLHLMRSKWVGTGITAVHSGKLTSTSPDSNSKKSPLRLVLFCVPPLPIGPSRASPCDCEWAPVFLIVGLWHSLTPPSFLPSLLGPFSFMSLPLLLLFFLFLLLSHVSRPSLAGSDSELFLAVDFYLWAAIGKRDRPAAGQRSRPHSLAWDGMGRDARGGPNGTGIRSLTLSLSFSISVSHGRCPKISCSSFTPSVPSRQLKDIYDFPPDFFACLRRSMRVNAVVGCDSVRTCLFSPCYDLSYSAIFRKYW